MQLDHACQPQMISNECCAVLGVIVKPSSWSIFLRGGAISWICRVITQSSNCRLADRFRGHDLKIPLDYGVNHSRTSNRRAIREEQSVMSESKKIAKKFRKRRKKQEAPI